MELIHIKSIAEFYRAANLGKPRHPLIAIYSFENFPQIEITQSINYTLGYYVITLKKNCMSKWKYGQSIYDYDEGIMGFLAPKQIIGVTADFEPAKNGWCLAVHPDFLLSYEIAKKIKKYEFFFYKVNEALILSEDEEKEMDDIFEKINAEINRPIDKFSQDVLIAQLDLLLTYSNRFYNRQFITRKPVNNQLLTKFENLLENYFTNSIEGLPSVSYFAERLHISNKYFSDMLKQYTGLTALQHIHEKMIEKAKEKLSTTELSISEIAYELGFEHSQSFSKLFKRKTNLSPLEFRQSFN
jgi:AraC-like DNA-binding protein